MTVKTTVHKHQFPIVFFMISVSILTEMISILHALDEIYGLGLTELLTKNLFFFQNGHAKTKNQQLLPLDLNSVVITDLPSVVSW